MEETLAAKDKRIAELEADLSAAPAKLDIKMLAQTQSNELSKAIKEHIKFDDMKYFKLSKSYHKELRYYGANLYIACLDNMNKLMIEKGIKATLPFLLEVKKSFIPSESTNLKVPEPSTKVEHTSKREVQKVES